MQHAEPVLRLVTRSGRPQEMCDDQLENLFCKAEDKLELALDLIKCVGCHYKRCDNSTGHNFMCNEISEDEFCSSSFDSWVLLSGGVVDTVFYKEVAHKHVYPKFLRSLVDAFNDEQTHFLVIG